MRAMFAVTLAIGEMGDGGVSSSGPGIQVPPRLPPLTLTARSLIRKSCREYRLAIDVLPG
jgi:hypothetical protein